MYKSFESFYNELVDCVAMLAVLYFKFQQTSKSGVPVIGWGLGRVVGGLQMFDLVAKIQLKMKS